MFLSVYQLLFLETTHSLPDSMADKYKPYSRATWMAFILNPMRK